MKILILDIIDFDKNVKALKNIQAVLAHRVNNPFRLESIILYEEFHGNQPIDELLVKDKIEQVDKIVISGSARSTYEDFHWKNRLSKTLDHILHSKKPTFAICFGAQFVAQHLGGKVIKNPNGTEFGSVSIYLTEKGHEHPLLTGFHQDKKVHATHNDRIEVLPSEATLLAYNDNSPVQAYQYENIFATQFHPDIPTQNLHNLLEQRKEKYRESGLIKDDKHLEEIKSRLHEGEASYTILEKFLEANTTFLY